MDNYSYGGTSFGGGGGGGGGFMPGEMTSPAGGKGDGNNTTLRPITIKQALDATQPYPEASFQIDGADVDSICFVGQVRNISTQSTNVTYKLDDGTGEIEAKEWLNSGGAGDSMDTTDDGTGKGVGDDNDAGKDKVVVNGYAKVFGRLKSFFGDKRVVSAHCVRPITDINELNFHLLESAAIHLFFTRGPPGTAGGAGAGAGAGAGDAAMGGVDNSAYAGNDRALSLTPLARRVYNLLKLEHQSNEGLHAQFIAAKLSLPVPDVVRASEELLSFGVIFPTIDDNTWAVLE